MDDSSPYFLHERVYQDELKQAFDAAIALKQDYLLWVMYTNKNPEYRLKGYHRISVHEALLGVRKDSVAENIQTFMNAYPDARLFMVVDLSREFANAKRPKSLYPDLKSDFDRAQSAAQEKYHQERMDARPWWRKVLGLQPK